MTNKTLGAIAMACAPFLCIDFLVHRQAGPNENFEHTSLSGLFSLVYMIGWMCSIVVMKRVGATGFRWFGVFILNAQLFTLSLANIWNVWEIVNPGDTSKLYFILDLFWPISQVVMLVAGITVVVVNRRAVVINGGFGFVNGFGSWGRFVPLLAGLWFPVSIVLMVTLGQNYLTVVLSGVYSAVVWGLMGWVCFNVDGVGYWRRWMSIGAVL
ncbi:MAG TPA: hypothetical protein VD993_09625 [Chitinophagaceae bacterium]|nr:hypothetical protein [Chitinophagaceae bacterium]